MCIAVKVFDLTQDDITQDEINDLIDAHLESLKDEEMLELTKFASEGEYKARYSEEVVDEIGLAIERLSDILTKANELQEKAETWDPYTIRSLQFRNAIAANMHTYKISPDQNEEIKAAASQFNILQARSNALLENTTNLKHLMRRHLKSF